MSQLENFKLPNVKEIKPGGHHEQFMEEIEVTAGSVALGAAFAPLEENEYTPFFDKQS